MLMSKQDFCFHYATRVRYSEIDAQRIVFNSHYLTFFDTAIMEYMRHLPYDYGLGVEKTGNDFHTVKAVVEFKNPARFDDQLEVWTRTSDLGRSSITFAFEIYRKDEDVLLADGQVVWVNVDQATAKTVPLPEALVERVLSTETVTPQRSGQPVMPSA